MSRHLPWSLFAIRLLENKRPVLSGLARMCFADRRYYNDLNSTRDIDKRHEKYSHRTNDFILPLPSNPGLRPSQFHRNWWINSIFGVLPEFSIGIQRDNHLSEWVWVAFKSMDYQQNLLWLRQGKRQCVYVRQKWPRPKPTRFKCLFKKTNNSSTR